MLVRTLETQRAAAAHQADPNNKLDPNPTYSEFDAEWKGWVMTGFFFFDAWALGVALQRMAFGCLNVGIRCKAALTTAIARKCYNMAHLNKDTAAEVVSFVASDIGKIFEGIQEIHYLWWAAAAAAVAALLWPRLGPLAAGCPRSCDVLFRAAC